MTSPETESRNRAFGRHYQMPDFNFLVGLKNVFRCVFAIDTLFRRKAGHNFEYGRQLISDAAAPLRLPPPAF